MKKLLLAALIAAASFQASASSVVLDFEDVPAYWDANNTLDGYHGLKFNNPMLIGWQDQRDPGIAGNGGHALNGNIMLGVGTNMNLQKSISTMDGSNFRFDGFWTAEFLSNHEYTGHIYGMNNGQLVYTIDVPMNFAYTYTAGDARMIDELVFDIGSGFIENMALTGDSITETNAVPEPASLALAAVGLMGCGLARRRKKA